MKLRRTLKVGMRGDDVALLINELQQLGYVISDDEAEGPRFGKTTRQVVQDFQRQNGLPITGEVDERTAGAINAAVDAIQKQSRRSVIQGQVRRQDGSPMPAVMVRASDKDLRSEQFLSEAFTNEQGFFRMEYTSDQFRRAEKRSADLIVRAFSATGTQLSESDILFNAPPVATVNLVVEPRPEARPSEFERLTAELNPALEGVQFADLTDEDIAFLVGETGGETGIDHRQRIEFLRQAARLSRETRLPAEAFYGWARQGLSLVLEELLTQPRQRLRSALEAAIEENIIPARLRESLDEIMDRIGQLKFDRGFLVAHEFVGQLLNQEREEPLAGFTVRAFDLDAEGEPKDLGYDMTDRRGRFAVVYTMPRRTPPEGGDGGEQTAERRLCLHILNSQGEEIHQTEIRAEPVQREITAVQVPFTEPPGPADIPVTELAQALEFNIPDELKGFLTDKGIRTLADIRRAGGIARFEDLPVEVDHESVRTLEAHANLSVLSDDAAERHTLIKQGFGNISAITRTTRAEFVNTVNGDLGDFQAAQLHVKAQAQTHVLNNILTGLRTDYANRYSTALPADDVDLFDFPTLNRDLITPKCSCKDCEAAVSPLAYLADLLDYAVTHLKNNNAPITVSWLAQTFHQAFDDLPVSCEEMDKKVRQVRICIEVLRSYFKAIWSILPERNKDALARGEKDYLINAYTTLLTRTGTSYAEIRLAQNADQETRRKLADRLGIDLTVNGSAPLGELFLDATSPGALTEAALERLFGLADTTRDPLSEGAKLGDGQDQITRWNLDGVAWKRNTDINGRIHVTLRRESANAFWVELYRDEQPTVLVAAGKRSSAVGSVTLTEKNDSELSGIFEIKYTVGSDDIQISAIPDFLSWRLKHLRTLWKEQDFPTDPYTEGLPQEVVEELGYQHYPLPIIDPDVIGPDDFRDPFSGNPAFDLWQTRRNWVDAQIQDLSSLIHEVNGQQVPNIEDMFMKMYQPVTYGAVTVTPWANITVPADFDMLYEHVTQSVVAKFTQVAKYRIETDLNLTVESFARLIEIRAKDQLATDDPQAEPVTAEQWREVYSILVQAQKRALYLEWANEEKQQGIMLGPKQFWISLREPVEGDWPPLPLEHPLPVAYPLVDPETLKLDDLPEPTAGQYAIAFWQTRRTKLDQIYKVLKSEREANGFDAMLQLAIGHPNPGDPLPHDLITLKDNLGNSDPAVVADAEEKIKNDLFMTVDDFTRLMEIKAKADQPDPANKPTAEEWAEVYAILTTAQKVKREFPEWIAGEQQEMQLVYWKALKAKLPRWRASAEGRLAWQQALLVRSSAPIIDPDVIGTSHLRDPFPGVVYDFWNSRNDWVNDQLSELKTDREAESTPLAGLDMILDDALGIDASDLIELAEQENQGNNIAARLEQLSLSRNAFSYLIRIQDLLASNAPILDSEWNDVYSILAQVKKRREFADWREAERTQNIILGPDQFKIPELPPLQFPPPEPEPLPPWRATWRDRRDWEDKLQARIDQETTTVQALQEVVSATEEETLPMLRDALIAAINQPVNFDDKANWVTDNLLIDAKADGCQMTTRVAQAIEAVQVLLWSVRTAQHKDTDTYPQLELDADHFDEEWKWIGSYTTWRSAMFVFLYPENILMPNLRKKQTPAFRKLVEEVRNNRRLTADDACEGAKAYSDYFQDVCTLTIEATCQTKTRLYKGDGCARTPVDDHPYLFYMFGRGKATKKVYWSAYNPEDESGYAQTFWDSVPGLDNVTRIVSAVPYRMQESQGFIFLFVLIQEKGSEKLVFTRYDVERGSWDSEPQGELEPPADWKNCEIIAVQRNFEDKPPELGFQCGDRVYVRPLDQEGTEFNSSTKEESEAEDEWQPFQVPDSYKNERVHAILIDEYYSSSYDLYLHITKPEGNQVHLVLKYGSFLQHKYVEDTSFSQTTIIGGGNFTWLGSSLGKNREAFVFYKKEGKGVFQWIQKVIGAPIPEASAPSLLTQLLPSAGDVPPEKKQVAFHLGDSKAKAGAYRAYFDQSESYPYFPVNLEPAIRVRPNVTGPFDIVQALPGVDLQLRHDQIKKAFDDNADGPESNLTYLREAYYFVPMLLGLELQKRGEYIAALDWFRTVYDYSAPVGMRKIYHGLVQEESYKANYERETDWLLDPLDPHGIGATRRNTNTRFTLLSLVRCFLEYANAEFTRDTAESVARARTLYLTALELLDDDALKQQLGICDELIGQFEIEVGDSQWQPMFWQFKAELTDILDVTKLQSTINTLQVVFEADEPWAMRFSKARTIVAEARAQDSPPNFAGLIEQNAQAMVAAQTALLGKDVVSQAVEAAGFVAADDFLHSVALVSGKNPETLMQDRSEMLWLREPARFRRNGAKMLAVDSITKIPGYYPKPLSYKFCVPPNPVIQALRLHAELNLYKIRTCRNIAGMERQLEPYASPTDTVTGLPMIGVGGNLVLPGIVSLPSTPYRYEVLIERAKQLIQIAAQIEAAMLSAIEKRDAEYYNLLQARQHERLAREGVRLQDLRLREAQDGVELARLQRDRAITQRDTFKQWIEAGLNEWELTMIEAYREAETARIQAEYASALVRGLQALTTAAAGGLSAAVAAGHAAAAAVAAVVQAEFATTTIRAETRAQIAEVYASYERRAEEWELQKSLADQDVRIGEQQIRIAEDQVRVLGQEQKIAVIQADHAKETLEFLANKFTNVELYDWMSDVLERVYSFFLQQASAMAKLAENQLAFERQETPPAFIQADYWEAPAGMEIGGDPHSAAPDRRGLTGSARLLQDIYLLDQYAFETNKRKLQLSKTISLARLAPVEFQRSRQTGVLQFNTPMELFDRDFPGHYLRLISRVRTSVVALIPPTQGIHATLSTTGLSRVVIGGNGVFQTVPVKRPPDSVALTSPINATGLFEITPQSQEMLLPFEGMGVDTFWEVRMPKASNQFDYSTIADVLIAIEYTALDSFDYRQQVIQQMDSSISADRGFSFRHQFADQWYDLNNPEQTATPMVVRFKTRREDFPPNLEDLQIQHVVLYFARKNGNSFEVPVTHLNFTQEGGVGTVGGGANSIDGIISTRKGNAGSWTAMVGKSPFGEWELALPNTAEMKNRFKDEQIEDILFVITYSGRTPEWPV